MSVDTEAAPLTDDDVLDVARAHGTRVAAEWSGWSRARIVKLRQTIDGYTRGRGHPNAAELAAMAPRLDCPCLRCVDLREAEAAASNRRWASLVQMLERVALDVPLEDQLWRSEALCASDPVERWFPVYGADHDVWAELRSICEACPVRVECGDFARRHRIPDGMFGGETPWDRGAR